MSNIPSTYGTDRSPSMTPEAERRWGSLAHWWALGVMVFSLGLGGFIASVVLWFYYKDKGPFVRQHAANAVNVQIITAIYLAISGLLMFVLIGFVTYPIVVVWAVVLHVIAAGKAHRGEWYDPPLTPRFVR
ncbi:MAG TPA: DUF4870 domain-containing protein [Marmoricola sp.]|nr:DUF4870 domain-containing protein [Marmoricola sp.]